MVNSFVDIERLGDLLKPHTQTHGFTEYISPSSWVNFKPDPGSKLKIQKTLK